MTLYHLRGRRLCARTAVETARRRLRSHVETVVQDSQRASNSLLDHRVVEWSFQYFGNRQGGLMRPRKKMGKVFRPGTDHFGTQEPARSLLPVDPQEPPVHPHHS